MLLLRHRESGVSGSLQEDLMGLDEVVGVGGNVIIVSNSRRVWAKLGGGDARLITTRRATAIVPRV